MFGRSAAALRVHSVAAECPKPRPRRAPLVRRLAARAERAQKNRGVRSAANRRTALRAQAPLPQPLRYRSPVPLRAVPGKAVPTPCCGS